MRHAKYLIICLYLLLCSCGTVGKLLPSFGYSKGNQSNSSHSANSGNGAGRDIKAKVNLIAGANKARNYDNSNIKSKDLNYDSKIDQGTSSTNFGGTHTDNSNKSITSTTNKDNKENKYIAQAQKVFNRIPISNQLFLVLQSWIGIFLGVFISVIFYKLGKLLGYRKHKKETKHEK